MKRILSGLFLVFISVLFIGTSATIARKMLWYVREEPESQELNLKNFIFSLDTKYTENIIGHDAFVSLNGLFNRITMSDVVPSVANPINSVYKLKNGYLSFIVSSFEEFDDTVTSSLKESVTAARETGAELLFLQVPQKTCSNDDFGVDGVNNMETQVARYRLEVMRELGFDTIDLHERLHDKNLNHYSLFFRTDHHWTADAGLFACDELAGWMGEKGFDIDKKIFAKENYEEVILEDFFLGSQGKQVGPYYGGVDDFKYFVPRFDTDYVMTGSEEELNRSGDFENTVIFKEKFIKDYFNAFIYGAFLGGDFKLAKLENKLCENGPKVLFVKDSYMNVVVPYFAAGCSEIHTIDPRHYKDSVSEYIRENDFDAVIVSLSARMENNGFNWED